VVVRVRNLSLCSRKQAKWGTNTSYVYGLVSVVSGAIMLCDEGRIYVDWCSSNLHNLSQTGGGVNQKGTR